MTHPISAKATMRAAKAAAQDSPERKQLIQRAGEGLRHRGLSRLNAYFRASSLPTKGSTPPIDLVSVEINRNWLATLLDFRGEKTVRELMQSEYSGNRLMTEPAIATTEPRQEITRELADPEMKALLAPLTTALDGLGYNVKFVLINRMHHAPEGGVTGARFLSMELSPKADVLAAS